MNCFDWGELACRFSRKVVKEILDENKGNIEEAATVIITAMFDEYLNENDAYKKLSSVFEEITASKWNSSAKTFVTES